MASIGGIDVTTFGFRMAWPADATGVIPGPAGVPGDAVITAAKKARTVSGPTGNAVVGDKAAGQALADRFRALASLTAAGEPRPVTVVDSLGNVWQNVRILSVDARVTVLAITNQVRVDCTWVLKVPVTGPSAVVS